jgi:CMP/dCMP kinase
MMSLPNTIAIDGPAASGKSTLALRLAQHIGHLFFDTGVMYRAITWAAMQQNIEIGDKFAISLLAEKTHIDVRPASQVDGRTNDILVDGRDVTWEIRDPSVDAQVSIVAAYPGVRKALAQQQRRVGLRGNVVMVGRDIGTVILPEADLKIFLDASAEKRARRRCDELAARGQEANYEQILDAMRTRDRIDSNRKVAPLRPAADAIWLHSDHLDADQVLRIAIRWVEQGSGKKPGLSGTIDLFTVLTSSFDEMVQFYTQVLGFIPKSKADGYVEYSHQGVRFSICARSVLAEITGHETYLFEPMGQAFELAFPLAKPEEVDEVYIDLLARGASPVSPPKDMPWGQRTAFFADPEGYIHEIFSYLPA